MKKRGISLIVLVITIIVIAILAGTVILLLFNNNTLDQSKKAKFMSDYRTVQEGVNLFSLSRFNAETNEFELPLKGYLSEEDKTYISEKVPTLKTKIEELSGTLDTVDLAWISSEDIGVKLSTNKAEKGYILDVANGHIYDYNGDYFEGQMWHTLDGGVATGGPGVPGIPGGTIDEELWDGWIKLTLYYPPNSTEKQWRLGTEGELRADPMLMWQNYTGPITIPLDRVKDVWIKYKLDNKEVIIPPAGTLLVDIVPDKTGYTKVPGVKVHINFDETATVKEYRVGDSNWMPYTGEFNVTENCIIEAKARKTETIYNTDGTVLTTRNIAGRDLVYIGNIGVEETELEAPTIKRLDPIGTEKARVQVTYPANADRKIYKVNYGIEENYEAEIDVQNYGTYIIAYYYDASGKRSKAAGIRINDTSDGTPPEGPGPYDPKPPREPGNPPPVNPEVTIPAPTVAVNPTAIAEEVEVSINSPAEADIVYIKLGRYGTYQLYTMPITVRENMDVYAYYRTYMGERSDTGYGRVSNIKKNNRPYVRIDADPYPYSWSYGASEVNVTINYSDATTIEYSEDGVVFVPYTSAFKVTQNKTIYARAVNSYGVTETSLNITNIGKIKPPVPMGNLAVGINVNPEPTVSTTRFTKATVSIDYDSKATEKYYRIGWYGDLKPYTGAFEVTSNCTIYAYAKGTNATGSTSKRVDNLSSGIAEPIISTVPGSREQSSKVSVTIEYDKYSKIKRYSIDGGSLRDYSAPFEVTKNGSVIYAYSENDVGQISEARYTVNNIVPDPPVLVLDKGQYYILKLNYPPSSKNREYKWKENGTWGQYKEAGILLLKPQYKDQLIQNGTLVKIENESGKLVTFTGDYYFIDVPISELFENLFMRWDREPLGAPQIVITPTEPSMQVTANIVYNPNLVTKLYKVINPDGSVKTDWTAYTGPITIDRNNSLVYAKGMDDTEVWTVEATKKVTNIDENPPVLKITADLDTAQQKVGIRVSVTDDVGVGKVKWAPGIQGESYFTSSGTEIQNNSVVYIKSNGYYTFYAEDQVGNKQVYTLNVTNVDLTAPAINITVNPEATVSLTANVTIDYGDSVTKQYKVGTANSIWTNYTSTFEISSYTILSNNWQNADGTVTIYAKGKDSANNEVTVQKKVMSLDLDKPKSPVITSNAGYPVLTSYGIDFDADTTITYDARTDIDNYYSIDNGTTWKKYNGNFEYPSGVIIAKSIKKDTGLEVAVSKTVAMPSDALKIQAYDGNNTTYSSANKQYILVDSSMGGLNIRMLWTTSWSRDTGSAPTTYYHLSTLNFLNESDQVISSILADKVTTNIDKIYNIPVGTKRIRIDTPTPSSNATTSMGKIYEIQNSDESRFSATNGYMLLHPDTNKAIKSAYQMVSIHYFPTIVQRLYKIGSTGEWKNYEDKPIWVNQGETIYAKGIDSTGKETRIVSSYTANVTNALKGEAYDENLSTYSSSNTQYMQVDSSIGGRNIFVVWTTSWNRDTGSAPKTSYFPGKINFLDENSNLISSVSSDNTTATISKLYNVPAGTKWLKIDIPTPPANSSTSMGKIYEVQISNEPTFSVTNGYMLIHSDASKAIKKPYQMVSINYFPTSVQRLYQIGTTTGEWLNYQNAAIWLNQGTTLYTKGIDKYGKETRVISSYVANVSDALKGEAYDGNDTTYSSANTLYERIDSSMEGRNIRLVWSTSWNRDTGSAPTTRYFPSKINFLDENKQVISTVSSSNTTSSITQTLLVPMGTRWLRFDIVTPPANSTTVMGRIYEVQPNNAPGITVSPKTPTNENVLISIRSLFATDTIRYSFNSTTWNDYTGPITVTANTTVYSKVIDASNAEYNSSITVNNIDKTSPTVAFGTNGAGSVKTASTKVTISDTGTAGINASSLQYVWDTQNTNLPEDGWSTFTNAATVTKGSVDGTYYLWIKAEDNAGNSVTACSNAFGIDNTVPGNPTLDATPTTLTNGNVTVTITYPSDTATKQYSTNGTSWSTYTTPLSIAANVTVYARALDAAGNQSAQSTITIANIDKTGPVPTFSPNGSSNIKEATTTVTVSDALAGLNESNLQYIWSTSTTAPASGWSTFTNGDTLSQSAVTGAYYLWIKATDNLGNVSNTRSTVFNIDNTAPTVPTIATVYVPNTMTNCTVTVTYPSDASKKEYSYDGENWQTYTAALNITNDTTIYVRATDAAGNVSGVGSRNIYILGGVGYIPTMTSDTTPSPFVVTSSSQYASTGHEKYRAFDKTLSTVGWASAANDVNDGAWIQIKLDQAITISKYYITARNDMNVDQSLKAWQLQGSNDGSNWDILDSQTNQVGWSLGELRRYNVNTTNSYQYFRLYITESNGSIHVTIDEMNIYQ